MRSFILCLIVCFFFTFSRAQLSGIYTVGGFNPDFTTITEACDSLEAYGVQGPVVINIRSGTYTEQLTIDSIPGNSSSNSVIIQSEALDSNSVEVSWTSSTLQDGYVFKINDIAAISIRYMRIKNFGTDYFSCIRINRSNVKIENCSMESQKSMGASYLFNSLTDIFGQNQCLVSIINCSFSGGSMSLKIFNDSLIIVNSEFKNSAYKDLDINSDYARIESNAFNRTDSTGSISSINAAYLEVDSNIFQSGFRGEIFSDELYFRNNYLPGGTFDFTATAILEMTNNRFDSLNDAVDITSWQSLEMKNNIIYRNVQTVAPSTVIDSNEITSLLIRDFPSNYLLVRNNICAYALSFNSIIIPHTVENNIAGRADFFNCHNSDLTGNHFSSLWFVNCDTISINENTIGQLSFSYGNRVKFIGNSIEDFHCGYTTDIDIFNNYIRNTATWVFNSRLNAFHNNFTAINFDISYSDSVYVYNNNLPEEIFLLGNINSDFDYNNYFPAGGYTEPHSISVNPYYADSINLKASNITLSTHGKDLLLQVPYDKDSSLRNNPPTIGAHEICISNSLTTINLTCGDSLPMSICNCSPYYDYVWHPGIGLSDSTVCSPWIQLLSDTTYILETIDSGIVIDRDTVIVQVNDFQLEAGPDTILNFCDYPIQLYATFNSNATYQWTPSTGLDNPGIRIPVATLEQSITYIVSAVVPGCNTLPDTLYIQVDSLPIAGAYLDSANCNYFSFYNTSMCADNYYWDFGDSTAISRLENPSHIYADTGQFLITLISCNSFSCDTASGILGVNCLMFTDVDQNLVQDIIRIFPNPVFTSLTITSEFPFNKIQVYNYLSEVVYSKTWDQEVLQSQIDFSTYLAGIYIIQVSDFSGNKTKKVVIKGQE
jgi:hypothetical protein